jgi:hypothetical protein
MPDPKECAWRTVVGASTFVLILCVSIEIGSPGDRWLRDASAKVSRLARAAVANVIVNL